MYSNGTDLWNPRQAFLDSSKEWIQYFGNDDLTVDEILLLNDCFYIPGQMGEKENQPVESVRHIINTEPNEWDNHLDTFKQLESTLNSLCIKLMAITNRDLLYGFYLILWELREEMEYVCRWIEWKISGMGEFKSPEFVPRKQGILYNIQRIVHPN